MLAINKNKFNEIVKDALAKSANYPRWQNAINKAVVQIELNGAFMHYDKQENYLVIWSQQSNEVYSANGTCQCKAFTEYNVPCWHRSAARLVRLYLELPENVTPVFPNRFDEQNNSPYLKNSSTRKIEKVGGVRI